MDKIQKVISKLSAKDARAAAQIINQITEGDLSGLDIKKLKGLGGYFRARFGKYRIIFYRHGKLFQIISIGKRNDNTYDI